MSLYGTCMLLCFTMFGNILITYGLFLPMVILCLIICIVFDNVSTQLTNFTIFYIIVIMFHNVFIIFFR